jgi:hypothetical protein
VRPGASRPSPANPSSASWRTDVRAMFVIYLVVIVAGLACFIAIGLLHN